MANDEHVALLKQGVTDWNEWRRKETGFRPDLSEADLKGLDLGWADLSRADLREADLRGADIRGAHLSGADLSRADLRGADLIGADLSGADLCNVDLRDTDLTGANLSGVDLSNKDLSGISLTSANLSGTNLSGVDLRYTDLTGANLSGVDLRNKDLTGVTLTTANLSKANCSDANLRRANFQFTNFSTANLRRADLRLSDLRGANLIDTTLDEADLTGSKLWETQRDGWSIADVTCQQVFWDRHGTESTSYANGEFERLCAHPLAIELHYEGGIGPIEISTLPMLLRYLEAQHKGVVLRLKSLEDDAGGAKATVVIDKAGEEEPSKLRDQLQVEAERDQATLRENLKVLESRVNSIYEFLPVLLQKATMPGEKHIHIDKIERLGQLGDISGDANVHIDQSAHYTQNDLTKISDLLTDILAHHAELKPNLPAARLAELETSLNDIQSQLSQQTPDTSLISLPATIKNILEGAATNVLASGWLKVLGGLL